MKCLTVLLATCVLFSFGCRDQSDTNSDGIEVRIASGGHSVHFLPLDLALALGFFEDAGLEPKVWHFRGGTAAAQALLAEQVDFSLNSIDHAYKAAAQGKANLRMILLLNQLPGMTLVVREALSGEVSSVAHLAGRRLGVTSRGSATHMVLSALLAQAGVTLDAVTVVDAGSSTFPPALESGEIDGGIALEPHASLLIERGAVKVLANLYTEVETEAMLGGPYNMVGVLTRDVILAERSELVDSVSGVFTRVLEWIQTHSAEEIAAVLPDEVVGGDRERYVQTLGKLREFYRPDGSVPLDGAANVLHWMQYVGALSPDVALDAPKFVDDRSKGSGE